MGRSIYLLNLSFFPYNVRKNNIKKKRQRDSAIIRLVANSQHKDKKQVKKEKKLDQRKESNGET